MNVQEFATPDARCRKIVFAKVVHGNRKGCRYGLYSSGANSARTGRSRQYG